MTNPSFPLALSELVKRLSENPDYMAYVLAHYQEQEGISDENLAGALGTLPHLAIRLALCRVPDVAAADFAARVRQISDFTLTDEALLASIIRQVSSIRALSNASERQLLSAARDREDPPSDDEPSPGTDRTRRKP
jgi:hypothetical protein